MTYLPRGCLPRLAEAGGYNFGEVCIRSAAIHNRSFAPLEHRRVDGNRYSVERYFFHLVSTRKGDIGS